MGTNYSDHRNLYSDEELVACYLKYMSQIGADKELGVSRETVARAVRRKEIALIGNRRNGKGVHGGSPTKITDEELIEEVKTLTCAQIATKHGMSLSRVYRRAKNLGIEDQLNGGGGNWRKRMRFYSVINDYDDSITLKRVVDKFCGICQICGKPIDWNAISGKHIRRMYPTVDHIIPLSKGGSHTWDNVQLAHMMCNAGKCDR